MKRILIKSLKVVMYVIVIIGLSILFGYLWPYPKVSEGLKVDGTLIRSVNIIDVATGDIHPNMDVLTKNGWIIQIDSNRIDLPDYQCLEINGEGKFIIPGLWDMHTHSTQHSPWLHHPLFIANGVTGIRDMSGQLGEHDSYWAGTSDRQNWNRELHKKNRTGPRHILNSSYQINGPNSVPDGFPEFFKASKVEDVRDMLTYYKNEGSDFIKVYSEIPPDFYRKLLKEADSYGIHVAGHKPLGIELSEAIELGQRSFEHPRIFLFESFPDADSLLYAENKILAYKKLKRRMVQNFDPVNAGKLMQLMQEADAAWVPTLQIAKIAAIAHKKELRENTQLRYVPRMRKMLWWEPDVKRAASANLSKINSDVNQALYESVQMQVKMAQDSGVLLLSGTDVTDSYIIPGFSIHRELEEFTLCGLTNLEALQSATINPARYAAKQNEFGQIKKGYRADLLLLEKNPLEHIKNTESLNGLLVSGVYYDNELIQELKDDAAGTASSFHMNVKFVVDLFRSPLMRKQFAD